VHVWLTHTTPTQTSTLLCAAYPVDPTEQFAFAQMPLTVKHVLLCCLQTNCDITLPEFEVQTIIGNSFVKFQGEDANATAKRVAACDNEDIRPVRVTGIRRAWNAPGVRAKALQVRQLLLLRRTRKQ